jgi:hypothetical protein
VKKYPSAWTLVAKGEVPAKAPDENQTQKKIEARINMSAEVVGAGKCPECQKPMQIVKAGGSRMWICVDHRITLPLPNNYEEKS